MGLHRKVLAGLLIASTGASCAGDHRFSTTSHSGGRRPDPTRFTLKWVHEWRTRETTEYLALTIPYGPIGVPLNVNDSGIEGLFDHEEGRDYYNLPSGAKEGTWCGLDHSVQGSVVILGHDSGGIRALLRVTADCPDKGRYDIEGEHTFAAQSVIYRGRD